MAIVLTDFDKIWASTSPLTPYSFSESNYKEGWNFIGSTPPARQMWDSIQNQNDEKSKFLLDNFANYLPLAGGTMTGAIVGNPLTLTADDGNDSADLVLNPNGSATWNAKELERVTASGSNYIRLESGLQICFGDITTTSDGSFSAVPYSAPFSATPSASCTAGTVTSTPAYDINIQTNVTTVAIGAKISINGSWNAVTLMYIAVGYWK